MNRIQRLTIYICGALLIFFAFPYVSYIMSSGQEESWQFIMNFAEERGWKFGRDLFFPYGNLNYLIFPYHIGHQLEYSIAIFTALYAVYISLIVALIRQTEKNTVNAFLYALACVIIEPFYITAEIFMVQIMMLLMYFVITRKSVLSASVFVVLYVMLLQTKYLEFFAATGMLMVYYLSALWHKNRGYETLIMFLAIPGALAGYLIYNPSFNDMVEFFKGMYFISKGQTIDHNFSYESAREWTVCFVPVFLLCWSLFAYSLLRLKRDYLSYYLIVSAVVYFYFKEGFVRHGGYQCFMGFGLLLSSVCLTVNYKEYNFKLCGKSTSFCMSAGMLGMALITSGYSYMTQGIKNYYDPHSNFINLELMSQLKKLNPDNDIYNYLVDRVMTSLEDKNLRQENRVFKLISTIDEYKKSFNDRGEKCSRLSEETLRIIGDNRFTSFPSELTYAYHYPNYKVMPGLQGHNSYHPFLEQKNVDYLQGSDAPEYILYQVGYLTDHRYPLLENPATLESIHRNYIKIGQSTTIEYGGITNYHTLLKRRIIPLSEPKLELIAVTDIKANEKVDIPSDATYMEFEYELGLAGHLATLFWKVPEITLSSYKRDKVIFKGDIVIDNLTQKTPLRFFQEFPLSDPFDSHSSMHCEVDTFDLSGEGLKYIKNIKIKWYKGG
ncbi:hypothetical protein [Succinivibrio dextrinosolvens]|uniref:hypothetical protein n=1 Tax=Succinivibrio dextrinosolvens TaxID=83771 RepID=UPI001922F582|nr:hypothetical protein [Succinivibrio dextrinosolvens]